MLKQLLNEGREIDRIVDHWSEAGTGMTASQLRDAVAEDLEMLEYTPAQVDTLVPQLIKRIKGK